MPPRRAPAASPAVVSRHTVVPSPAQSTRSTRRRPAVDDSDQWDRQSVDSTASFQVPNPKGAKKGPVYYPSDTSVQIAAAFNAAQTGQHAPSTTSARPRTAPGHRKAPSTSVSAPQRQLSPAQSILSSARALSPVRYFLRPNDESAELSGELNSFSSLGEDHSAEASYTYSREEEFVRAAQQSAKNGARGPRVSDAKRRKGRDDDMPYRPGKDDEVHDADESDGEGEGIVRTGGLNGRAGTRGQRAEKGEGYLGNGLGIQPKERKIGRKSGMETDEGIGRSEIDEDEEEEKEPYEHRGYSVSPFPDHARNGRSATPMQIVRATLTPRPARTSSAPLSRRRHPSAARTMATNILHGIAISLRFVVDLLHSILSRAILRPLEKTQGPSKAILERMNKDRWKWLLGLFALSLGLRLADGHWRGSVGFRAPDLPPSSMDELVARLTSIEQALSSISTANRALEQHEAEGRKSSEAIVGRLGEVEQAVSHERKRLEIVRVGGERGQHQLQTSLESIKKEVKQLASRIVSTEAGLASASGRLSKLDEVDREVQSLKDRVGAVERDIQSVLEDGRLRTALERILPTWMPVRRTETGSLDIDPVFWTEMKRVLVGQGEVETLVRKAMGGKTPVQSGGITEAQLDAWGDKLYDRQVARGDVVSRTEFIRVLEGEVSSLKGTMEEIRSRPVPSPAPAKKGSAPIIKSPKGDDLTSALQELIDAALLRYSKDTIARPDYALFTAGGRVVPSITSDTLVMSSPGALGRVILGRKPVEGLSPAHALMPDNTVGKCWPFKGDQGQLGIMLSRRVVVGDLTLEHAASEVAVDIRSAPRDVEVWGLVEGQENKEKARSYLDNHAQAETASLPPSPDYLLLSSFTYDPSLPNHVQTFPVDPEIQAMGIDMGIVVFKIASNWGGDFTCLYRARVHGEVKAE
ncbi:UNC-like C-terminal-domain-containing protein [Dioszegia hungarica]|uniref:UNC-like C-terminal-domain-containing protein n=1 Tax=Dioszegia hungarica TaxID=4972 RepID=A0AA38HET4_9TREE|nr:UNC-like C-terminal-domain-containing protein [Dioszegia hungarica]KAI9638119.1 UNC-like C-terminal-domain-containing protein [Dioszegia hungarica]